MCSVRWWSTAGREVSPMAFETTFGWILAGSHRAISLHTSTMSGDDLLRKFWEIKERVNSSTFMSAEESYVVTCTLLMGICCSIAYEVRSWNSRGEQIYSSQTLPLSWTFVALEGSVWPILWSAPRILQHGYAEWVQPSSMHLPPEHTFYLPMHTIRKSSSSTTKIRAVFDASVKSSSSVSLNDLLLVDPTIHSTLLDVLLRFCIHHVALTTDVSCITCWIWQRPCMAKKYLWTTGLPHDKGDVRCVIFVFCH